MNNAAPVQPLHAFKRHAPDLGGKACEQDAIVWAAKNNEPIDTHHIVCTFGRHRGTLYTRMPVGYLTWMVNAGHEFAALAQAELDRRGTNLPTLEVSPHALNRVSQRALEVWLSSRDGDEGLHAWTTRQAAEALKVVADHKGRRSHLGLKWVFSEDSAWPVLVTVMKPSEPFQLEADD